MTNLAGRRRRALLLVAAAAAVAGCGGGTSSSNTSQVRSIDVATNTINAQSNSDTTVVLVNGAADAVSVPYGVTSPYLFVTSGVSSFAGGFPSGAGPSLDTNPPGQTPEYVTVSIPQVSANGTSSQVLPQPTNYALASGQKYTAYLCGVTDITDPTQTDLADLDPRYLRVAVLQDNQPAPPAGSATVRVLVSAPDAGAVDVFANGAGTAQFPGVGYAPLSVPGSSANVTLPAGTVTFQANAAGTSTVLIPSTSETLAAGGTYTLVVGEPLALPIPEQPHTAPTFATYTFTLVRN
jgi:hypothetical protein